MLLWPVQQIEILTSNVKMKFICNLQTSVNIEDLSGCFVSAAQNIHQFHSTPTHIRAGSVFFLPANASCRCVYSHHHIGNIVLSSAGQGPQFPFNKVISCVVKTGNRGHAHHEVTCIPLLQSQSC